MCPQMACMRRFILTLFALVWFYGVVSLFCKAILQTKVFIFKIIFHFQNSKFVVLCLMFPSNWGKLKLFRGLWTWRANTESEREYTLNWAHRRNEKWVAEGGLGGVVFLNVADNPPSSPSDIPPHPQIPSTCNSSASKSNFMESQSIFPQWIQGGMSRGLYWGIELLLWWASEVCWGTTFDLRKRRFPKLTIRLNLSKLLKIWIRSLISILIYLVSKFPNFLIAF